MMRNKFLALALALAVLCSAVHADSDVLDFSVGLSCSSKEGWAAEFADPSKRFDWKDLDYGLEVRTKLTIFELDAAGKLGTTEDKSLTFSGLLLAGISEDFLPFLRLGFCFGPQVAYLHDGRSGRLVIDGNPVEGSPKSALTKSRFHFRGTADFLMGEVIKIGMSVTIPTDYSIASGDLNLAIPSKENLEKASYALVVQMRLI